MLSSIAPGEADRKLFTPNYYEVRKLAFYYRLIYLKYKLEEQHNSLDNVS